MNELIQVAVPALEPVAEVVSETAPALDPKAAADAATFAGMVADDPDATQRYIDSLLRVLEIVQDPAVVEVMRVWSN